MPSRLVSVARGRMEMLSGKQQPGFYRVALLAATLAAALTVAASCGARDSVEGGDRAKAPVFRAGAATVDITPPTGLPMWGYGARKDLPATGVHDPLEAGAVVFEAGERRLALVGLDLGRAPARRSMERIREGLRDRASVDTVFVIGSHTHHGPCLELETVEPTSKYIDALVEKIIGVVEKAAGRLAPARIGVATAEVDRNRNRHTKREPKPVDRELAVLRIDAVEGGAPIATIVNFAAHPTTRRAQLLEYSADFPGPLREHVEKQLGGVCVFLQGACGDLSTDRRGLDTDAYGAALGEEVVRLARVAESAVPARPSIRSDSEEFRFSSRVDLSDPVTYLKYCVAFFKDLVDAYVEEYREGVRPRLEVAVLNGEIALVGASGEFFCTHALRLKSRSPLEHTFFLGYANGYHQYFPTREAVEEGGYGADPPVAPAEVGAGERITDRALELIRTLSSATPEPANGRPGR